jgi:signal transduction histidine kinase
VSLQRALLLLITVALIAGIVPAGVLIDQRLAREIESRARGDLAQAPRLLGDYDMAIAEGLRMHAKEVARSPGVLRALRAGNRSAGVRAATDARGGFGDRTVLVTAGGESWSGPPPGAELLAATRRGETPVSVVSDSGTLHSIALAPVTLDGQWLGAAGVTTALGRPAASTLAALTRSDVLILAERGSVTATTTSDTIAKTIASLAGQWSHNELVREITAGGNRFLVAAAPLGDVATVVFVRDLTRDLAVLPNFRRIIALSGVGALLLGVLLGTVAAVQIARPVRSLADAADRLAAGDSTGPLMPSAIREVHRLSHAFDAMRDALAGRMREVIEANRELADRQARLTAAQSEILQRERLAVSGRLVAELSHEIRNPIANVRNCLEIIRRRVQHDAEGREFTELAIDELLRMHELAEQMLDLNRPRDPAMRSCRAASVAREVARLVSVGEAEPTVTVSAAVDPDAAIAPDALKQVLLNIVRNAREATAQQQSAGRTQSERVEIALGESGGRVRIDVYDSGPGIPVDVLPRIFDPFFTTKGDVQGVGLGLFVAEGLIRAVGGRITAANAPDGGAHFLIELPQAQPDPRSGDEITAPAPSSSDARLITRDA